MWMLKRAFLMPALPPSFLQMAKQREGCVNLIDGSVLKGLVHMMGFIIAFSSQLHDRESRAAKAEQHAAWVLFLPSDQVQHQEMSFASQLFPPGGTGTAKWGLPLTGSPQFPVYRNPGALPSTVFLGIAAAIPRKSWSHVGVLHKGSVMSSHSSCSFGTAIKIFS